MKVFLSWSGDLSLAVAEALHALISNVIQTVEPFISSHNIRDGSMWNPEINDQLKTTTFGVVCLTPENQSKPWVVYEAGALSKGNREASVAVLLIGMEPNDVDGPLAQFNHTRLNKESIRKLLHSVNNASASASIAISKLDAAFDKFWPDFEAAIAAAQALQAAPSPKRKESEIIDEILTLSRQTAQELQRIRNAQRLAPLMRSFGTEQEVRLPPFLATSGPGRPSVAHASATHLPAMDGAVLGALDPKDITASSFAQWLRESETLPPNSPSPDPDAS